MSTIIEQMIKAYDEQPQPDKRNMMKEIMQEMALCGLSRAGFSKKAAFYGGTALRIFYGLDRFSEDLGFSLKAKDESFDLTAYFPILEKEIAAFGLQMDIEEKRKSVDSHIQSAFLKGNTKEHLLLFYGNQALSGIHAGERIRIMFEVDTNPPNYAILSNSTDCYRLPMKWPYMTPPLCLQKNSCCFLQSLEKQNQRT